MERISNMRYAHKLILRIIKNLILIAIEGNHFLFKVHVHALVNAVGTIDL